MRGGGEEAGALSGARAVFSLLSLFFVCFGTALRPAPWTGTPARTSTRHSVTRAPTRARLVRERIVGSGGVLRGGELASSGQRLCLPIGEGSSRAFSLSLREWWARRRIAWARTRHTRKWGRGDRPTMRDRLVSGGGGPGGGRRVVSRGGNWGSRVSARKCFLSLSLSPARPHTRAPPQAAWLGRPRLPAPSSPWPSSPWPCCAAAWPRPTLRVSVVWGERAGGG